jgi:hypothetical protein
VSLPDEVRDRLESAAKNSGHSIAEEIRQRLERTFEEDSDTAETRQLLLEIQWLADLVAIHTGHEWFSHPASASVMKQAIDLRLAHTPGGDGTAEFGSDELPPNKGRLGGGSNDPRMIAIGLDGAIESNNALLRSRGFELGADSNFPEGGWVTFKRAYRMIRERQKQPSTEGKEKKR